MAESIPLEFSRSEPLVDVAVGDRANTGLDPPHYPIPASDSRDHIDPKHIIDPPCPPTRTWGFHDIVHPSFESRWNNHRSASVLRCSHERISLRTQVNTHSK